VAGGTNLLNARVKVVAMNRLSGATNTALLALQRPLA